MKLVVIHGEDTVSSRKRFSSVVAGVKKKGWEVVNVLPGDNTRDIFSTTSLFYQETLYVIEHCNKVKPSDIDWIAKNSENLSGSVLLYQPSELSASYLRKLPKNAKVEKFELPSVLFSFLDSLYPGNSKKALTYLHSLLEQSEADFVFFMTARHLRDLWWVASGGEGLAYPPWRVQKISRQASMYKKETLVGLLRRIGEIDIEVKKGRIDMQTALDLAIASYLQ